MAKRSWTLPHQIAYLYFSIGIMGQGDEEARDTRMPVIAKKFTEWPFEGADNNKILQEAIQVAVKDMEDSMEPVIRRLESSVTSLAENLSSDNLGAIVSDLFDIINSASPTEAEIEQIKAIAEHFGIETQKPEIPPKDSERTTDRKRTLLHEMAYLYFDLATQNTEQSDEEFEAKAGVIREKLTEWTEDKNTIPHILSDTLAELSHDRNENVAEYVERSSTCRSLMKAHFPGEQLTFVIDDLLEIINAGTPHEAEIQMVKSLAEYFEVSLEGKAHLLPSPSMRPPMEYQNLRSEIDQGSGCTNSSSRDHLSAQATPRLLSLSSDEYPGDFYFEVRMYKNAAIKIVAPPDIIGAQRIMRKFTRAEVNLISRKIRSTRTIPYLDFIYESLTAAQKQDLKRPFWFLPFALLAEKIGCMIYFEENGIWGNTSNSNELTLTNHVDSIQAIKLVRGLLNDQKKLENEEEVSTLWLKMDGGALSISEFHGREFGAQLQIIEAILDLWMPVVDEFRGKPFFADLDSYVNFKAFSSWEEVLKWSGTEEGKEAVSGAGEDNEVAADTADEEERPTEYAKTCEGPDIPASEKLRPPIIMTKMKEQYRDKVREALADGKLTDLERSGLDFFQHKLGVSDEDALIIFEDVMEELKGKSTALESRHPAKSVKQSEEMKLSADDDTADEAGTRKKRITYVNWNAFETEQQAKDELKKKWMPIAKRVHGFIQDVLRDNNLKYELRYGDGTFSFYVPTDKAKSRQRKFARFGLVSFTRRHCYLDGLYVTDVRDVPQIAHCDTPNDDMPTYSLRFVTMDDFEQAKDVIEKGVIKSYGLLAQGQTSVKGSQKPGNAAESRPPGNQGKASNLAARAMLLANQGNWDEAENLFSQAIEMDPSYALAYKYRGIARLNLNETSGALEDCESYLKFRPEDSETYRMRGKIKGKMGEHAEAIEDFSKAIEHGKNGDNLSVSYYLRGYAQSALKRFKNAIRDFDEAIRLDPKYEYAYYSRGLCKLHIDDKSGAIRDLKMSASLGCNEAKEMLAQVQ